MRDGPGPVALVGSGEFLPAMEAVDAELLDGRPGRAVVLPTAAAREGDARVAYWLELAHGHFEAMGVETVGLDVRCRADADDPAMAARVRGAGLVYLSGGDPRHLSDTLRATLLWDAISKEWEAGAAIGGCSAGAMALTSGAPTDLFTSNATGASASPVPPAAGRAAPDPRGDGRARGEANGLGLVPTLAVMPHFDRIREWRPDAIDRFETWRPAGVTLVGVDEDTALLATGDRWVVRGAASVQVFGGDHPAVYRHGDRVPLGPAPS